MGTGFSELTGASDPSLTRAKMKRHGSEEISRMLHQAQEMMRGGMSQKDVCRKLGISVMTLHRWRKTGSTSDQAPTESLEKAVAENEDNIEALKLENHRLRRIVSDLLLEKMKVQEALDKAKK